MESNPQPADIAIRTRFATEIDANFSLICPAGSGKTHTLVERVATCASVPDAEKVLSSLVVVTFTKKAAEEMQSRARELLLSRRTSAGVQNAFSRAFFGTIHSFAVSLLRSHGHLIGVPSSFEVVADSDNLLYDFLRDASWRDHTEQNPVWKSVLRHIPLQEILDMAARWDVSRTTPPVSAVAPSFDFSDILNFPTPKRADTAANIVKFQETVRAFQASLTSTEGEFSLLPEAEKGGKEFLTTCQRVLGPVALWLQSGAAHLAGEIFFAFRNWRIHRGVLSYDDQVSLAALLLQHPEGKKAIRRRGFRVLLDEAQDTDPQQFDLLINSVLPEDQDGSWRDGLAPDPGRFSMVGDKQQSIYGSRADLLTYRAVHDYLVRPGVGESLEFSVTFRCDEAIIRTANALFPAVLDNQNGQVSYVTLAARPNAGTGQVIRLEVPPIAGEEDQAVEHEAEIIANFIAQHGPGGLRAANLGQIALLVPRTKWFLPLRAALLRNGIRSALLSQADYNYDSPAYVWLTALTTICADPRNSFEIVGVLRELFGISDRDLAFFCQGNGNAWQIADATDGTGLVVDALNQMHDLSRAVAGIPLREAVGRIDETLLRARLRALPVAVYGDVDAALVPLLATAAAMETEGADLREFAEHLRENLKSKPEVTRESPDCVNILTNLKSKGLQWDCVILPFFARKLSAYPPKYPALVGDRYTPAQFAFSKDDAAPFAARKQVSDAQELQRVLYVSVTRPKQTLVLLDDIALFGATGVSPFSLAGAARVDADNQATFMALPTAPQLPAIPVKAEVSTAPDPLVDLTKAVAAAANFPKKLSPHAIEDDDAEPAVRSEERLRSHTASEAINYGIWWHDTMKTMPWAKGPDAWSSHFAASLQTSPMLDRARYEWRVFLGSALAALLAEVGITVVVEAPFMIQAASGNAIEGVIDLAIHRAGKGWIIADWKTGQSRTQAEALLEDYGTQVRLYRDSVAAMTNEPAEAWLYPTATGGHVAA